ncbi:MAG: hypothetical protein INQ03_22045 [Candidatus Heimdallarchaeota archaeon]|nr:hypothetical protein [Candidatus Heimdallarchaeota archaeon]
MLDDDFDDLFDNFKKKKRATKKKERSVQRSPPKKEKSEPKKQEIEWRLRRFEKIIRRSESLEIEQLAALLEFDENALLLWLINLPDNFGFKIIKNEIQFNQDDIEDHIDDLMDSYYKLEEQRIGKME